jgi:hypothetical protein
MNAENCTSTTRSGAMLPSSRASPDRSSPDRISSAHVLAVSCTVTSSLKIWPR